MRTAIVALLCVLVVVAWSGLSAQSLTPEEQAQARVLTLQAENDDLKRAVVALQAQVQYCVQGSASVQERTTFVQTLKTTYPTCAVDPQTFALTCPQAVAEKK